MEVTKKLLPGAPGTKRFKKKYGRRLVCVRYRKDPENERRLTTVEIVVDERPLGMQREPLYKAAGLRRLVTADEDESGQ